MYNVSNQFIEAIKKRSRKLKAYYLYKGSQYKPITFTIEDNIYSNDNFIGSFIGKSGAIKIDFNDNLELQDGQISIYIGVELSNNTIEYVPLGTFNIYESSGNTEYKFIDNRIKFNVSFDIKKVSFPTTPLLLLEEACRQANTELLTREFPNKDLVIQKEVFFGYNATCANVVEAVAQASCTVARINRSNKLELKWFKQLEFPIGIENQAKYPVLQAKYGPINSLVLAREPQNDNVFIQDEESIAINELTELKISNNPLLDIDRYTSRIEVFDRINGFSYIPIKVESQGFFHLDALDIVSVQQRDGTSVDMLIMNHSIKYSGGVASVFETPALTKTQINYAIASSIESKIYRTELEVDKVNNRITAEIEEITEEIKNIDISNYHADLSSTGTTITCEVPTITLTAALLNGSKEVATQSISFNWRRISGISIEDTAWNNAHKGTKSITLTSADLKISANFYCAVSTVEWSGKTTSLTVTDDTKIPKLSGSFLDVTGAPQVQTLNTNGTYSPSWIESNPTITPAINDGLLGVPLDQCTIVFKRIVGGVEQALITGETVTNGVLKINKNILSKSITAVTYVCYATYKEVSIKLFTSFSLNVIGKDGQDGTDGIDGLNGRDGTNGLPGPKGADGKTPYTHIAYANSFDGKLDFSVSDSNRTYMGMFVDFIAADSADYTKYAWSKIKGADGTQGIPGPKGVDGKTPYFHVAYATNATGTSGFSTTDSTNKTYIGNYTDYISADSTDPTKYSWTKTKGDTGPKGKEPKTEQTLFAISTSKTTAPTSGWSVTQPIWSAGKYLWKKRKITYTDNTVLETNPEVDSTWEAVNDLEIGGRNLISNTSDQEIPLYGYPTTGYLEGKTYKTTMTLLGDEYIMSFDAKSTVNNDVIICHFYNPNSVIEVETSTGYKYTAGANPTDGRAEVKLTTQWARYWIKYKIKPNFDTYSKNIIIGRKFPEFGTGTVSIKSPKLEKGNKPTDWTPAPEDIQSQIDTTVKQLNDIANDSKLTPNEKTSTKKEWLIIADEYPKYKLQASGYSVSITAYTNAYNALNSYLNTTNTGVIFNMTTTTDINSTTFTNNFKTYYNCKVDLINAIELAKAKNEADNIQIGVRNLLLNSTFQNSFDKWGNAGSNTLVTEDGYGCVKIVGALGVTKYVNQLFQDRVDKNDIKQNYTVSAWVKCVDFKAGTTNPFCNLYFSGADTSGVWLGSTHVKGISTINHYNNLGWQRMEWTVRFAKPFSNISFYLYCRDFTGTIFVRDVCLVKGNKAIDHIDAPEDVQEDIDNSKEQVTTMFTSSIEQTKKEINLKVQSVLESVGANASAISSVTNEIELTKEATSFIKTTIDKLQDVVDGKVDANTIQEWARFDGASLELGASNTVFKAILTNTELGFYQSNNKIAWISNNELHSVRAAVEISLSIGPILMAFDKVLGFTVS